MILFSLCKCATILTYKCIADKHMFFSNAKSSQKCLKWMGNETIQNLSKLKKKRRKTANSFTKQNKQIK